MNALQYSPNSVKKHVLHSKAGKLIFKVWNQFTFWGRCITLFCQAALGFASCPYLLFSFCTWFGAGFAIVKICTSKNDILLAVFCCHHFAAPVLPCQAGLSLSCDIVTVVDAAWALITIQRKTCGWMGERQSLTIPQQSTRVSPTHSPPILSRAGTHGFLTHLLNLSNKGDNC